MRLHHILLALFGSLFFILGINAFISSSEFWPIFISKYYFSFDSQWRSLFFKPIFNLFLYFPHLLPLNDVNHLRVVKAVFSANGVLQFGLVYAILVRISKTPLLSIFCTLLIATSVTYFSHYFAVRSDQLALSFFLLFFYLNVRSWEFASPWNLFFIILFPLIGFKQIYFSLFTLVLLDKKMTFAFLKANSKLEKIFVYMLLLGISVWIFNAALISADYFINSFQNYKSSFAGLNKFLQPEYLLISISSLAYFSMGFRVYLSTLHLGKLAGLNLLILFVAIVHPQKFGFFLASLSPLYFLSGVLFLIYLISKDFKKGVAVTLLISLLQAFSLYQVSSRVPLYMSNHIQLQIIAKLSAIVEKNRLTYLDGMGLLPRQKNTGCFASPNDYASNQSCLDAITNHYPDSVIVTTRLLLAGDNISQRLEKDYRSVWPNFYVRKDIVIDEPNVDLDWRLPVLNFGTDFN